MPELIFSCQSRLNRCIGGDNGQSRLVVNKKAYFSAGRAARRARRRTRWSVLRALMIIGGFGPGVVRCARALRAG